VKDFASCCTSATKSRFLLRIGRFPMTPFDFDGLGMGMTCTPDLESLFKSDLRALALFVSLAEFLA
jgi:hypothetical protein